MSSTEIIKKAITTFFRHLKDFIIVIIVFAIITGILGSIRSGDSLEILENPLRSLNSRNLMSFTRTRGDSLISFLYSFLKDTIINLLIGANFMAILDLIRGYTYGVGEIKDKITHYYPILIPVAALYTAIIKLLGLIPIIGWIIGIILYFALLFVYFLLEDYPDMEPIEYLKLSYELTKGHKLNLALLWLMVMIIPIVLSIIIVFIFVPSLIYGGGFVLIFLLFLLGLTSIIATSSLFMIATTIYYDNTFEKI